MRGEGVLRQSDGSVKGDFWEEVMSKQVHRGSVGVCGNEKKLSLANINVFVNMCI